MPYNPYPEYMPKIAFGFRDIGYDASTLYYKDGTHVGVHALQVYKNKIHGAFIGVVCTLDTNGHLSCTDEARIELLNFLEVYKAFHNIEDIALSFSPVITGNWKYNFKYKLSDSDTDSDTDSDCD